VTTVPYELRRECTNIMAHDVVRAVDRAICTELGARQPPTPLVYWVAGRGAWAGLIYRGEPGVGTPQVAAEQERLPAIHIKGWGTFLNACALTAGVDHGPHPLDDNTVAGRTQACVAHEWGHWYVATKTEYGHTATALVERWRWLRTIGDLAHAEPTATRAVALARQFHAVDEGWARFIGQRLVNRLLDQYPLFADGLAAAAAPDEDDALLQKLTASLPPTGSPWSEAERRALLAAAAETDAGRSLLAQAAFVRLAARRGLATCLGALSSMHKWASPLEDLLTLVAQ